MRYALMAVWLLLSPAALAEVSVGVRISVPGVSIGINVPAYPDLVLVPGYPVYYAPDLDTNYFFYDGLYWIYVDDHWYVSDWYNGPWGLVEPDYVPVFLLRIPVFYYMRPPVFFHAWVPAEPPHWGEHWGHDWARRHADWTRWSPGGGPAPAPLPGSSCESRRRDRSPSAPRRSPACKASSAAAHRTRGPRHSSCSTASLGSRSHGYAA